MHVVLPNQSDPTVVVIGAGAAGLAAARRLRAGAIGTYLIDALPRTGGRAYTGHLGTDPFDLGATWLHNAHRNPLVPLACPSDDLVDTDAIRHERTTIAGREPTSVEHEALDAAWNRLDRLVEPLLDGPDMSLADALAPMAADLWTPLLLLWEGAIIAGADADSVSLKDWHRNRLTGANRVPRAGVGTFVNRVLTTEATLSCPATRIAWGGSGVSVDTPRGTVKAAAAIITVSTGVLAAGTIRFDPPLPVDLQAAIHRLPMGLLSKIALPARSRLGLDSATTLTDRHGSMTFSAWPLGRDYLAGFAGGRLAWELAAAPVAFEAHARVELTRILGASALNGIGPAPLVSDWGTNPAFLGAYAYAAPGDVGQRKVLADAFPGERLIFAGEATRSDSLAGTLGGAYLSGIEAAERLLSMDFVQARQ